MFAGQEFDISNVHVKTFHLIYNNLIFKKNICFALNDPIHSIFWGRQFNIWNVRFMDFHLICDNLTIWEVLSFALNDHTLPTEMKMGFEIIIF